MSTPAAPAPRLLRVRCTRWDQVESFLRKKLRADGRLSMKVPFDAELGAPVTLQLELPNQIVIALEGQVAVRSDLDRPDATVVALGNARPMIDRLEAMLADARAGGEGGDLAATLSVREAELRRLRQQAAHEVLGVSRTPTLEELRRAWRLRARREHPDAVARFGSAALRLTAEEAMIHVTRAYERLRATVVAENRAVLAGTSVRTRGSLALEVAPSEAFEAVALTPAVEDEGGPKPWKAAASTRPAAAGYPAAIVEATPPEPAPPPVRPTSTHVRPTPNRSMTPLRGPSPTTVPPPVGAPATPNASAPIASAPIASAPRTTAPVHPSQTNPFADADPLAESGSFERDAEAPPPPPPPVPPRRVTAPMPAVRPPRSTSSQPPPVAPRTTTPAALAEQKSERVQLPAGSATTLAPLAAPATPSPSPIVPPPPRPQMRTQPPITLPIVPPPAAAAAHLPPPPVELPPLLDTDADTLDGFERPMSRPLALELDLPLPPPRPSRPMPALDLDADPSRGLDAMTLTPSAPSPSPPTSTTSSSFPSLPSQARQSQSPSQSQSPIAAAARSLARSGSKARSTGPGTGNTIEQSLKRARSGPGDRFVRAVHDRLALADHAGAAQIATAAHQVYPLDVRLRSLIEIAAAAAACAHGDRVTAAAALEAAIAIDPDGAEAHFALAALRAATVVEPSIIQDRFR